MSLKKILKLLPVISVLVSMLITPSALAWTSPTQGDYASITANCSWPEIFKGALREVRKILSNIDNPTFADVLIGTAIYKESIKITALAILHAPGFDTVVDATDPPASSDRLAQCVSACNAIPEDQLKTQEGGQKFEEICCNLNKPPGVNYIFGPDISSSIENIPGFGTVWAILPKAIIQIFSPMMATLDARCKKTALVTGSGGCFLKAYRPDTNEACCMEKTEATVQVNNESIRCAKIDYTKNSPASCKPDGIFGTCCICKGTDAQGNVVSRAVGGSGFYNCKLCTHVCNNPHVQEVLKGAKPDFAKLPYKSTGCYETQANFEGDGATNAQGGFESGVREYVFQDMFCFTQAECTIASGDPAKWKAGFNCPTKGGAPQGHCKAPDPNYTLQNPIGNLKTVKDLSSFISFMYNFATGLLIVAAALMFMWGGFKYMLSGISKEIESAKETMVNSIIGLTLGLAAYVILQNVAPNTVNLKTYDIDMINRLNFYNVMYCRNIPTQGPSFADAGSPPETKPFSSTYETGFPLTAAQTECGTEYFIKDASAQDVCMGEGCKDGGMCMNCTTGLAPGCKTHSAHEFRCADCKMGGNVTASKAWKPDEVWYYLFCAEGDPSNADTFKVIDVEKLADQDLAAGSEQETGNAAASGYVTSVCIADKSGPGKGVFEMNASEITKFGQDCNGDPTKIYNAATHRYSGMVMMVFLDREVTFDLEGKKNIVDDFRENGIRSEAASTAFSLISPGGLLIEIIGNSQWDNYYYVMNKNMCDSNIRKSSIPVQESLMRSYLGTKAGTMELALKTFWKASFQDAADPNKKPFDYFFGEGNAWTIQEAAEFRANGMKQSCGFSASTF